MPQQVERRGRFSCATTARDESQETSLEASLNLSRRLKREALTFESLEERRLLSSTPAFPFADVRFGGVLYEIAVVSGPGGVQTHRTRNGMVAINLLGTTQDSQVTITGLISHRGRPINRLAVASINVRTGHVGSIQGLTSTNLMGRISPLQGIVNSLQFNSLGPAAQITVIGNLGQLTVNQGISSGEDGPDLRVQQSDRLTERDARRGSERWQVRGRPGPEWIGRARWQPGAGQ